LKLGKVNTPLEKGTMPNDISTKKVPLLILSCSSKKQIKKLKIYKQMFAARKEKKYLLLLYFMLRPLHLLQVSSKSKKFSLSY